MLTVPTAFLTSHDPPPKPPTLLSLKDDRFNSTLCSDVVFAKLPEFYGSKFPEKLQPGSAFRFLTMMFKGKETIEVKFVYSLAEVTRDLLYGFRFFVCNLHGRIPLFPELTAKTPFSHPVGSEKSMFCRQYQLQKQANYFVAIWYLIDKDESSPTIPWTLVEFHPSAQLQISQSTGLQATYRQLPMSSRFAEPSFVRSTFRPRLLNDNTTIIHPQEKIEFQVINQLPACICALQCDKPKLYIEPELNGGFGVIVLPDKCKPGNRIKLRLLISSRIADEIILHVQQSSVPQNSHHDSPQATPQFYSFLPHSISMSRSAGQPLILRTPSAMVNPLFCTSWPIHHPSSPSISLNSSASQSLPLSSAKLSSVPTSRPLPPGTPVSATQTNRSTSGSSPLERPQILQSLDDVTAKGNYLCGIAQVELFIRAKRRGQWQPTNVAPSRIGKMRKCSVQIIKLTQPITILVHSSNANAIKLSSWGRSSSEGVQMIHCNLSVHSSALWSFYIIPTKLRAEASITISIEFPGSKETYILHQWVFAVAGHKFESSKAGLAQSDQNKVSKKYFLFIPEKDKVPVADIPTKSNSQSVPSSKLSSDSLSPASEECEEDDEDELNIKSPESLTQSGESEYEQ